MRKKKEKPLILLAICTRDAAVFEAHCAQGIAKLSFPPGFRYEVLLVENRREASPRLGKVETGLLTHCFLEPELGLSAVRNRVFAEAERLDAEWVACLDDDVQPVESWLEAYAEAMKSKPHGRLFHGQIWYRFPSGYSLVMERGPDDLAQVIEKPVRFGGGNLLIHASLYRECGLRFDQRFDACGGEDTDFRRQAALLGIDAVPVPKAVIRETITGQRITFKVGFHRKLNQGVASILMLKKYGTPLAIAVGLSIQLPRRFFNVFLMWVKVLFACTLRSQNRPEVLHAAWASLAQLTGNLLGLCGYRGSYYARRDP